MRFKATVSVAIAFTVLGLVAVPHVSAQSLADVARAEAARRTTVARRGRVYTNDTLSRDTSAPAPRPADAAPAAGGAASAAPAPTPPPPAATQKPAEPQKDQAYWKQRMSEVRGPLERSRTFADALQSRINALTADFTARDDPAQRAQIEQDRVKAVAELERVQREIVAQTKAITDVEDEARKAGVPPGWLR